MPFIGTREIYRRQGMCRRLLSAIETELCSLKVELLIIPAITEHLNTWTTVFGFHQLEDWLKKEMKSMSMLVFPETDMLQKELVKPESLDGVKLPESIKNQSRLPVLVEKCDPQDSGSPTPAIPSKDNSAASASDSFCESDVLHARKGTILVENKQKELSSMKDNANSTRKVEKSSALSDVDANDVCNKKTIDGGVQQASDSSVEVSVEDAAETINKNQNSSGTDKADVEREIPLASRISSSEDLA
ncbi:Histone acetyltransferase [Handroanthus impetiginosus]|uniref:Histone acetyltransferase n=1 Tax=Handroanthus impetiginosus TaxID=429701 RepID=A0A2G9GAP3_9LAMI|nr:Histone acetyltransferase [Handroanthus impetiginosus]